MTKKQIKEKCLERYNNMFNKYMELNSEDKQKGLIQFGQCLGFIHALYYAEVITSEESDELTNKLR